ncbi:MAG: response regulator transcription factor [Mycolicibacterium sp.]|nr:response regulator transcription factor [Mycolicibacterium sp.]
MHRLTSSHGSSCSVWPDATGHTIKSTAKSRGLSVNTVGTHLRSIYAKLNVRSRVQLANARRQRGELP